jgi:hypothetical protein
MNEQMTIHPHRGKGESMNGNKALEALKVGMKVWENLNNRVVTLKELHRTDSVTNWWRTEEDDFEWREDSFEKIPYYVQGLLSALVELAEIKKKPSYEDCVKAVEVVTQHHCPYGEWDNAVKKEIIFEIQDALRALGEPK